MTSLENSRRLPRHASSGRLYAPDGGSVPVSINHHGDDIYLVIVDGAEAFTANPLDELLLESSGTRGMVRTPGSAELIEANLLRFWLEEGPELVQRRNHVRVVAAKNIVLENELGETLTKALTVDISGGGVRVQLPRTAELPEDGRVYVTVYLGLDGDDDPVCGWAQVVRRSADHQVALAFDQIPSQDKERLIRFVFERQRVALRVTRGDTI